MPDVIEIHTTDRTTFKQCRQRWDFSSNTRMNLEPLTPYEPFWFGTAIHEGVATWYKTSDEDAVYEAFFEAINDWYKKLEEPDSEDKAKRDELGNMGLAMLEQYILFSKIEDNFKPVWIERAHQLWDIITSNNDAVKERIHYKFRCDGLVLDEHGRYWILEHKTCASFPGDGQTEYLMMDDQVGTYIWALQIALGIKVEGVIYNWLKKKQPKPLKENKPTAKEPIVFSCDKAQDTTYAIAKKQLFEVWPNGQGMPNKYVDFLDFLYHKPNNFVRREKVRRNKREIQIIGESLPMEIHEMIDNPSIYRSPSRLCNSCVFFDPCLLKWSGGDWEELLESNYKQREER